MAVLIAAPARAGISTGFQALQKERLHSCSSLPLFRFRHTRKYLAINLGSNSLALLLPELTVNRGRYCHLPGVMGMTCFPGSSSHRVDVLNSCRFWDV